MRIRLLTILALAVLAGSGSALAELITFSEFPYGTPITNQYADKGVTFEGVTDGPPIISYDGCNPFNPVLSPPGPLWSGDFRIRFTAGARNAYFLSGCWNAIGIATIDVYDVDGGLIGSVTNTKLGLEEIKLDSFGTIGSIYFSTGHDYYGAVIDNLAYNTPEPSAFVLFGSGVLGAIGILRRKMKL